MQSSSEACEQDENSNTVVTEEQEVLENSLNSSVESSITESLPGSNDSDSSSDFGFSEPVQSSSYSESEDDREDEEKTITEKLESWTTMHRLSKSCVDELLQILCPASLEISLKIPEHCSKLPRLFSMKKNVMGSTFILG